LFHLPRVDIFVLNAGKKLRGLRVPQQLLSRKHVGTLSIYVVLTLQRLDVSQTEVCMLCQALLMVVDRPLYPCKKHVGWRSTADVLNFLINGKLRTFLGRHRYLIVKFQIGLLRRECSRSLQLVPEKRSTLFLFSI